MANLSKKLFFSVSGRDFEASFSARRQKNVQTHCLLTSAHLDTGTAKGVLKKIKITRNTLVITCHHLSTVPSTSLRIQTDAYLASPVGFHHGARQKGEQLRTCLSAKAPLANLMAFQAAFPLKSHPLDPHVVATLFVSETEGPWPTRWDWSLSATLFTQSLPSSGHLRMDQTDVSPT